MLARCRESEIGSVSLEAKYTFLLGAAGLTLGFVWLAAFHFGERAPFWPIIALSAAGALVGLPIDLRKKRAQLAERERAAATRWDPVVAVGEVETVVAETSRAVRVDDNQANTAWFLQVGEGEILCVWDWADAATSRVEVDLVPAPSPTALAIRWSGSELTPLRPKRKFKRGEREPEQCEVLSGDLAGLDELLKKPTKIPTGRKRSRLANQLASVGFYKYLDADQVEEAKLEPTDDVRAWYESVGRAFDADAERLAEGGVGDLLDYMRPALAAEGCELGNVEEAYDSRDGYRLTIDGEPHVMWNASEGKRSWELTVVRSAQLVDELLEGAGSEERVHLLDGGEDGVFVLLTPVMQKLIEASRIFRPHDLPVRTPGD